MSDTPAQPHSATSSEGSKDSKETTDSKAPTFCEAFNSPAGNVFFKSSDDVVFRVEDFYLKANSGLFRDMLIDSVASTSLDNPLPIDEDSKDFKIVLLVIVGRGQEALKLVKNWNQAENLYQMANKYQIDSQRHWFSRMCAQFAAERPWDALFLACNASPMDTDIIREAIAEGFQHQDQSTTCDPRYFTKMEITSPGSNARCWSTIRVNNITTLFGLKLGLLGLLAYRHTFAGIATALPGSPGYKWENYAQDFVRNVKAVEKARDIAAGND